MSAAIAPNADLSGLGSRGARAVFLSVWLFVVAYATVGWGQIEHPLGGLATLIVLGVSALTISAPVVEAVFPARAALATACAPVLAIIAFTWSVADALPAGRLWLLQVGGLFASLLPVRGRVVLGIASVGAQAVALAVVGALHGDIPRTLAQVVIPAAGVGVAIFWRAMLRRSVYLHDQAEALTRLNQIELEARRQAATLALTRLRAIEAMTDHILTEIIDLEGEISQETRTLAARQGWAVRDVLRAPGLATTAVSDAVAQARDRGVQVRLLDDDPLARPVPDVLLDRVIDLLAPVTSGTVTVRITPPGRTSVITVVIDDGETSSRVDLPET